MRKSDWLRRLKSGTGAARVVAMALVSVSALAQTQSVADTVRGVVQMKLPTGNAVSWESVRVTLNAVTVPGPGSETFTDEAGMYYFRRVRAGSYTLVVETVGRQRQRYPVTIAAGVVYDIPPVVITPTKDYIDAFRDGIKAVDARDWVNASKLMRDTLNLQAATKDVVKQVRVYGMRVEPYAPNYFLATALVELKRCTDAATPLSLAAKEVQGTSLESRLAALRTRCG